MVAPQPFFRARGRLTGLRRIRALIEAGHSVDLITYPFGEDIEFPGSRITRSARIPLVKDIRIGPSIAKLFLDFPLYLTTRRALKTRTYDVLHTPTKKLGVFRGRSGRNWEPAYLRYAQQPAPTTGQF